MHREVLWRAATLLWAPSWPPRSPRLNAGLGRQLPSNKSGLPLPRQEFASLAPQKVTIFTDLSCFRNALKIPA